MEKDTNTKAGLFQDIPVEQREESIKANAYAKETMKVKRAVPHLELQELKHDLSQDSIIVRDKEAEIKKVMDEMKANIKPLKLRNNERLDIIKNKYRETEETVYLLDNQITGQMEMYDKEGNLIGSRPLLPSENQHRIELMNTGTHGE